MKEVACNSRLITDQDFISMSNVADSDEVLITNTDCTQSVKLGTFDRGRIQQLRCSRLQTLRKSLSVGLFTF